MEEDVQGDGGWRLRGGGILGEEVQIVGWIEWILFGVIRSGPALVHGGVKSRGTAIQRCEGRNEMEMNGRDE